MVGGRGGHHRCRRKQKHGLRISSQEQKCRQSSYVARVHEISKISGGQREPTQTALSGWGISPPKPKPGTCVKKRCRTQALTSYMAQSRAVVAVKGNRHYHWRALSVLECVVERGEILEPPPDSRVMVPNYSNIFQDLVIRKNAKLHAQKVAAKALDRTNNATCFQNRAGSTIFPSRG